MFEVMHSEERGISIAKVATSSDKLPTVVSIIKVLQKDIQEEVFLSNVFRKRASKPLVQTDWNENILTIEFEGGIVSISLMGGAIDWDEISGPCQRAWWFQNATEILQKHTNHFQIAIIQGRLDPVERNILLSKITAVIAKESDAVGVFWPNGQLMHKPDTFIQLVETLDNKNIVAPLWVDVRIEKTEFGVFCYTIGLNSLGFLELEVPRFNMAPEELYEFIFDIVGYMIGNRLQIPHGDTVGRTANERFKVAYNVSMFKQRGMVMQLIME